MPRSVSASQGANATIDLEAFATYDGTNDPVLITGSQAYTAGTGVTEVFTLGPATINGAPHSGQQPSTKRQAARMTAIVDCLFFRLETFAKTSERTIPMRTMFRASKIRPSHGML